MDIHKEEKGMMQIRKVVKQKINAENTERKKYTGKNFFHNPGSSKRRLRKEKDHILHANKEKEETIRQRSHGRKGVFHGTASIKRGLHKGKDYVINGMGKEGETANEALYYGVETPIQTGQQVYRFTKELKNGARTRKANKALKKEIRERKIELYENFAAARGDSRAVKKVKRRISKSSRKEYKARRLKARKGDFLKNAVFHANSRLTGDLKNKIFQNSKSDAAQKESTEIMSFSGGVLGRSGSLITRILLQKFKLRLLFGVIGIAALMVITFAVPFAIIATPFGIFFYQGQSDSEQKNPDDILRDFFSNKGLEIQRLASKGKRTITEKVPKEVSEEVTDENGKKTTVTKTIYEDKTTTTDITSDIIYDYNGSGSSNFYDILATFSVIYGRREGAFSNWEEDGNHEPEIDEDGNLSLSASPSGTVLMGKLMTSAVTYKTETRTVAENDKKEEYTVVVVKLKTWEEIADELPGLRWGSQVKDYLYPPNTKEEDKKGSSFVALTQEEKEQLKEIYEELKKQESAPMLPGTISGYGDVLDPNATTIDDGSATAVQLTIANNARTNNGNYPAIYGWCAAWVGGIYGKSGRPTPHGNAIDYWVKWGKPEQASKSNVPIGAAVITTGDPNYGHIGIYIGNGLVASNLGGVKIEPLATFGNTAPVYTGYEASMRGKQGYLGWVWPDGIVLGPTPQSNSAEGWKKGIASAYGGWSDAQIADNAITATGEAVTESSMGVAIPMSWANVSSYYGHKVLIRYNGKTVTATINDCGAMDGGKRVLDLQPGVFKAFGATSCNNWGLREVEYKIL